jgi:hypothetical protein
LRRIGCAAFAVSLSAEFRVRNFKRHKTFDKLHHLAFLLTISGCEPNPNEAQVQVSPTPRLDATVPCSPVWGPFGFGTESGTYSISPNPGTVRRSIIFAVFQHRDRRITAAESPRQFVAEGAAKHIKTVKGLPPPKE